MNHTTLAILAFVTAASTACTDIYLSDDIDLEFNFNLIGPPDDELHVPYVLGTNVRISAYGEDVPTSATVVSSDDGVLVAMNSESNSALFSAVGVGMTDVCIMDSDESLHCSTVEVRAPTRAELYAHGELLVGDSESEAFEPEPVILTGGTGTFLVRYFDGAQRLYGNGVLEVETNDDLQADHLTTFVFENREWLQLTPQVSGEHMVRLRVNDRQVANTKVVAIPENDVTGIELRSENGVREGEMVTVVASGIDAFKNTVYGIEFDWDLDGVSLEQTGDLYRYEYSQEHTQYLTASHNGLEAVILVHGEEGHVGSTNKVGCSAGGGNAAGALPLLMAFIMLRLRRRRITPCIGGN